MSSSSDHQSSSQPLRVGVVGASIANSPDGRERWAVRAHVPALLAMNDFDLVAVCTSRAASAEEAAERFGIPEHYGAVDDMLASCQLDAVCVSLQPHLHHGVAMRCLDAGLHVYLEQPMAADTDQARELAATARRYGVRTVVGHRNAHSPEVLYMTHLITSGYIGTPLTFQHSSFVSAYIQPRPRHRAWLFDAKTGRPTYRSAGSFDRVTAVIGSDVTEVSSAVATQVTERPSMDGDGPIRGELPDNMAYLVRLNNGCVGTIQVSKTAWFGVKERFDVYGSEGMLRLTTENPRRTVADHRTYNSGGLRLEGARADVDDIIERAVRPESIGVPEPLVPTREFVLATELDPAQEPFIVGQAWKSLLNAIRSGSDCRADFEEGLRVHEMLDAGERAAQTGQWETVVSHSTGEASIRP